MKVVCPFAASRMTLFFEIPCAKSAPRRCENSIRYLVFGLFDLPCVTDLSHSGERRPLCSVVRARNRLI